MDVALHALDWVEAHEPPRADLVVLLPATAPLRGAVHIGEAIATFSTTRRRGGGRGHRARLPALLDAAVVDRRLHWLFPRAAPPITASSSRQPTAERVDLRGAHRVLRGQRTFYPRVTAPYVMPREASVNIDSELDFEMAERLLARRRG